MTKQDRIEAYRKQWEAKTKRQVEKELESYQRYLAKHRDTFFKQSAPDELTDGDRVRVLKEIIEVENGDN